VSEAATETALPLTNASDVLEHLLDTAGNDRVALERIRDFLAEMDDLASRARVMRDYTACRLRQFGVPNTEIARLAGVADSYIARRTLERGAERRVTRPAVVP
jgi:hypothetical protein